MWEKSKRVLVSSVLSLSLIGNTTVLATVNNPTQTKENENIARNYLKVSYEGKVLFHELIPSKTMIQVLNENNDVLESTVLTSDKEMNLEKQKVSNGKMLSYWSIEMKDGKLLIKPVLTTKEEFSLDNKEKITFEILTFNVEGHKNESYIQHTGDSTIYHLNAEHTEDILMQFTNR
ncbi:hypothetical protein JG486_31140 (plasmid) [Bacillus mycoides]|nr:hypothetical protein JG486_31140 [Bacillus mycoides]